jgi:alpha-tubulin suppressor-like RCC1 family protein
MQQVNAAVAAGTWPSPPSPHLLTWGNNGNGLLGLNNTTNYSSPKQVGTNNWTDVTSTRQFSAAVRSDGTLWSWGANYWGQLGLGNNTSYSSPKQVGALTNWLNVAGGYATCLAIKTDGTLWSWGYNGRGSLGNGSASYATTYNSPVQVGALSTWYKVYESGFYHTLAIKTDGTLWAWGYNSAGQLGLGDTSQRNSPVQVGALTDWLVVSGGVYTSFAVRSNGTMWSWGISGSAQFGPNLGQSRTGAPNSSSPTQIGALTTWLAVAGGAYTAIANKSDGTLWSWGYTTMGGGNSPVQVGAYTTWTSKISVSNGGGPTSDTLLAGIQSDGTLWTWGFNSSGQLGLGNTTTTYTPTKVGSLTTWTKAVAGQANVIAIALTN